MDIVVKWKKMGPEFSYTVLYARNSAGPWIRHNAIRLTDDVVDLLRGLNPYASGGSGEENNEYTISDLDEQTNYSFRVTCYDRYESWWYSYDSPESITGGLSDPATRPDPDGGNIIGFQFCILMPVMLGIPGSYEPGNLTAAHWIHDIEADEFETIDVGGTV